MDITIIIGNPPYNVGQINENDNNKNRVYPVIERRIRATYGADSQATNRNALSDAYVKFFRWATERLGEGDGIICFVTNNGFVRGFAFDGFRKHLAQDFTHIYHLDLGGNMRKGDRGNVFGIRVGVGITILVRKRTLKQQPTKATIGYQAMTDMMSGVAKLAALGQMGDYRAVRWEILQPDERYTWLTHGLRNDFERFIPMGMKAVKMEKGSGAALFAVYSIGINTSRDSWMYDFDRVRLANKVTRMVAIYHAELSRWMEAGCPVDIDSFVLADDTKIKWSSRLKACFARKMEILFQESNVRRALYRPFTRQYLYFDRIMTHRRGVFPRIFPTPATEKENVIIWLKVGSEWPMFALASNVIADLLPQGGSQCFPFYTYDEDGSNRRENITDWALAQFQARCGDHVTKWDIFDYIYAVLHHPVYREHYAENLKRDLPRLPLPISEEIFATLSGHGKALVDLHIGYEEVSEYGLELQENREAPVSWRVEKMRLSRDRQSIIINPSLMLYGIPAACFEYQLGNRSALEWVIDQYQVKRDPRSNIINDPNRLDEPDYIVRLVQRIVTVSMETVRIVGELGQAGVGDH